ncbi:MAG: hypothetical protein K2N58_04040 [Treponemataceae bacterium]|nr:hypothetical protein [Treponemataceae bacterium]
MTQTKKIISPKYKAILLPIMLPAALRAAGQNLLSRTPQEITGGGTTR